jgi:hypothetical protein
MISNEDRCGDGNGALWPKELRKISKERPLLFKGSHRGVGIFEDFEEVEDTNELQSLQSKLGGVEKLQRTPALFGGGEEADEKADAARIDHGHVRQIQKEAGLAGVLQIGERPAELIEGRAQHQFAAKFKNFHSGLGTNFDVQGSSSGGVPAEITALAILLQGC